MRQLRPDGSVWIRTNPLTCLNEARFGLSRTGTNTPGPFANSITGKDALAFFPNAQGIPFLPQLGTLPNGPICLCGGQPR